MNYIFDVDIACKVGVNGAIFLNNLLFWIKKNEANETNFFDGRYWTYNSIKAYQKLFPFWSEKQIRTIVKKLVDDGYVMTGHYSDNKYDRSLWYSLTDKGYELFCEGRLDFTKQENDILPYGETDLPKRENESYQKGECKYRYKPDEKPDGKQHINLLCDIDENVKSPIKTKSSSRFVKPTIEEIRSYCFERCNTVDAERFYDYYESNGWMVGKNKMKDWKAAVRTWERSNYGSGGQGTPNTYHKETVGEHNMRVLAEYRKKKMEMMKGEQ